MTITTQDTMIRMYRKKALMFETINAFANKRKTATMKLIINQNFIFQTSAKQS